VDPAAAAAARAPWPPFAAGALIERGIVPPSRIPTGGGAIDRFRFAGGARGARVGIAG
jgi:hypothetical protein